MIGSAKSITASSFILLKNSLFYQCKELFLLLKQDMFV